MKELDINRIHEIELSNLNKLIKICDSININYFLAYGSLLGAVRHRGFIPWDDDLDVIMLRDDYERFVDYCTDNESRIAPYRLMNHNNTKEFSCNISRFCNMDYKMVSENKYDLDMGVFIDIYPYDLTNKKKNWIIRIKKQLYMRMVVQVLGDKYVTRSNSMIKRIFNHMIYRYSVRIGIEGVLSRLEKMREEYYLEDSDTISCLVWDNTHHALPKAWFEEYDRIIFEGLHVRVPRNYHLVLKEAYGDYMKLPPVEKRVATHHYKIYERE